MIKAKRYFFPLVLTVLFGCFSAPEYPNQPQIEFESIIFKEVPNLPDSLILTIGFTDGDGDLGLFPDENEPPYNDIFAIPKDDGSIVTLADRANPPYDTLPPYEFPYSCTNYITPAEHGIEQYQNDTIYIVQNENHFNIFIEYFVKRDGQYFEFDWETAFDPLCSDSYNGRFPVLGDLSGDRPLEGRLRYGMTSSGFLLLFRNDTLRLRISIKDRALNDSNVIETPDFVLGGILVE